MSEVYVPIRRNSSSSDSSNIEEFDDIITTHVIPVVSSKNIVMWQNRFVGWSNRVTQFFWTSPSGNDIFNVEEEHKDSSWLQTDQSELCPKCKMKYSMFRRKEACRICSMVFCDKCLGPEKICDNCRVLESPLSKSMQQLDGYCEMVDSRNAVMQEQKKVSSVQILAFVLLSV